jgi:hypothetical protein
MPHRIKPAKLFISLLISIFLIVCMMAWAGTVAFTNLGDTLDAEKTSSARSECAREVVNQQEDDFRHRIGQLLSQPDPVLRLKLAMAIKEEEPTQHRIDRVCPAALVETEPIRK